MRPAHAVSCSMAAARNVSAAARSTFAPRALKRHASFAIVVVLPVPLTPTTRMTAGTAGPASAATRSTSRDANSAEELVLERHVGGQVAAGARAVEHLDRELGAHVRAR